MDLGLTSFAVIIVIGITWLLHMIWQYTPRHLRGFLFGLVIPLVGLIYLIILTNILGLYELSKHLGSVGTLLVLAGSGLYVGIWHSRKIWPNDFWLNRMGKVLTFTRLNGKE